MQGLGALSTGANGAEMVVAVDAGGVAVREADLQGVVADDWWRLARCGLGLNIGKRRKGSWRRALPWRTLLSYRARRCMWRRGILRANRRSRSGWRGRRPR